MGRGPRRPRLRFRDEPNGAHIRELVRRGEPEPNGARDANGQPIDTRERRRLWQAESDRIADWFLGLHPATQRKMTVFVARCPANGCLLGRVFRRGDPRRAVRYVWLGVTWANRGTAGILNWGWDGGRGSKEFMVTGCAHGTGNVEFGLLDTMVEALDYSSPSELEEWIHHLEEPIRRGLAGRTLILPDTHWKSWT